jgi:hypothetical protein
MSTRILDEIKSREAGVALVETQTEAHEVDEVSVDRMLDQALVADSPQVSAWTKVGRSLLAFYGWISGPAMTDRERIQRQVYESLAVRSFRGQI